MHFDLQDQSCILWDINSFSFVRQLNNHAGSVVLVTINQLNVSLIDWHIACMGSH